jgi:hypothetical protein
VISILKPGKEGTEPAHYRRISLLSVNYKLFERITLQRIHDRGANNCTKLVMAVTTHIETGLQRQLKTGAVFVDLTAAYATVWRDELMLKLMNVVCCSKLYSLLDNMLVNGYVQVSYLK